MSTNDSRVARKFPIGAELVRGRGIDVRIWAPRRHAVRIVWRNPGDVVEHEVPLSIEENGYFRASLPDVRDGATYGFRLDDDHAVRPDPASRYQPDGPHGWSQVVDPTRYPWRDQAWRGVSPSRAVLYELHVGTFTPAGTFAAAEAHLEALRDLGVTVVEVMPVADFPGRFGWGYDGVNLFAPSRLYGTPDELRHFVDYAHRLELAVILDVVYNHFGPDGNYLGEYSSHYTTHGHGNEWGDSIDFDGPHSAAVREFFVTNARYWIDEFHFDGLRLDATHAIFDRSTPHIVREITAAVRVAARGRATLVYAENDAQPSRLVRSADQRGDGVDGAWNDDLHHTARVAATGARDAYFADFDGDAQSFVSAAKRGYLYQGQPSTFTQKPRGENTRFATPASFVAYLENHDQVANSLRGARLHQLTSPSRLRALTAYLLLIPSTPLLFQGQEYLSSKPFLYFADHHVELAPLVARGRADSLARFATIATPAAREQLDVPHDEATFHRCVLDADERLRGASAIAFHRELLRIRRFDRTIARRGALGFDGAVLFPNAFVLRWFGHSDVDDRLLVVNLGHERVLTAMSEPLIAPPTEHEWTCLFHSEDPSFGGRGAPAIFRGTIPWSLHGESAALLAPSPVLS